jgi:hypothetical protein
LPYIEQAARFDAILSHDWVHWMSTNADGSKRSALCDPIAAFSCPSDSNVKTPGVVCGIARSNINISRSDVAFLTDKPDVSEKTASASAPRMLFSVNRWVNMSAASDGTSNTIAISEIVTCSSLSSNLVKQALAVIDGSPQPQLCLDAKLGGKPGQLNSTVTINSENNRGSYFSSPTHMWTGFNTILSPNSPSCTGGDGSSWGDGVLSSGSNHAGGVNAGLLDGSIRFISETIQTGDLTVPTPVLPEYEDSGYSPADSPYGVWGALGTPAGSELKGL